MEDTKFLFFFLFFLEVYLYSKLYNFYMFIRFKKIIGSLKNDCVYEIYLELIQWLYYVNMNGNTKFYFKMQYIRNLNSFIVYWFYHWRNPPPIPSDKAPPCFARILGQVNPLIKQYISSPAIRVIKKVVQGSEILSGRLIFRGRTKKY